MVVLLPLGIQVLMRSVRIYVLSELLKRANKEESLGVIPTSCQRWPYVRINLVRTPLGVVRLKTSKREEALRDL